MGCGLKMVAGWRNAAEDLLMGDLDFSSFCR